MPTVNIYDAKTQLSKMVDLAAGGTDVLIARRGDVVARLTSLKGKDKRMNGLGSLEGKGWIAEEFDAPLSDKFLTEFEGR